MFVSFVALLPNILEALGYFSECTDNIVLDKLTDWNASPPPSKPWFIYVE